MPESETHLHDGPEEDNGDENTGTAAVAKNKASHRRLLSVEKTFRLLTPSGLIDQLTRQWFIYYFKPNAELLQLPIATLTTCIKLRNFSERVLLFLMLYVW